MDFYQAVAARRSVRSFLPTPVPDDAVDRALAAAQLSPSPLNSQPWRFIVLTGGARERLCAHVAGSTRLLEDLFPLLLPDRIAHAAAFLSDLGGAPLVVVITYPAQPNEYDHKTALLAVGAAAATLQLAFAAEGLGSVCVTSAVWVEDRIRDDLGLGDEQLATIIPVGYLNGELTARPPRRDTVQHHEEWPD
jgi:nitroreductase